MLSRDEAQDILHREYNSLNTRVFAGKLPRGAVVLSVLPRSPGHYGITHNITGTRFIEIDCAIVDFAAVNQEFTLRFLSLVLIHEMVHLSSITSKAPDHGLRFWWQALRVTPKLSGVTYPLPWSVKNWPLNCCDTDQRDHLLTFLVNKARRHDMRIGDLKILRAVARLDKLTAPEIVAAWGRVRGFMEHCLLLEGKSR